MGEQTLNTFTSSQKGWLTVSAANVGCYTEQKGNVTLEFKNIFFSKIPYNFCSPVYTQ